MMVVFTSAPYLVIVMPDDQVPTRDASVYVEMTDECSSFIKFQYHGQAEVGWDEILCNYSVITNPEKYLRIIFDAYNYGYYRGEYFLDYSDGRETVVVPESSMKAWAIAFYTAMENQGEDLNSMFLWESSSRSGKRNTLRGFPRGVFFITYQSF